MIALISPAKTLDIKSPLPDERTTAPRFEQEAQLLAAAAAKLGPAKLARLMHISSPLAKLNAERFRSFEQAAPRPAIRMFAGDVYQGFEAKSLDEVAMTFAQDHVRMLSGLYGLLRPLDLMRPYRLEMGTRWAPGRKPELYRWWGNRVSAALAEDLAAQGDDIVINLASREYWQVVEQALPIAARIITIDFRDAHRDGPRFNSFAAKRARGMMARYLCEHRLGDPDALKAFDSAGYRYDPAGSSDATWRFVRAAS